MSEPTVRELEKLGYRGKTATAHVADGSRIEIAGLITIPIQIMDQVIWHEFQIMSAMDGEILIGVDLWADPNAPRNTASTN